MKKAITETHEAFYNIPEKEWKEKLNIDGKIISATFNWFAGLNKGNKGFGIRVKTLLKEKTIFDQKKSIFQKIRGR